MNKFYEVFKDTPWKIPIEMLMYLYKPIVLVYLKINGVTIGSGSKFYGFPKIYKAKGSSIKIGNNFECRSWWFSNPIGINHPTIICTWKKGASIEIGNDVGMSGGSIISADKISLGNGVLIGANSVITDTDFHPTKGTDIRYSNTGIKSFPVTIGDNVFIGMNAIILKGNSVKNDSVIGAGEVLRHE